MSETVKDIILVSIVCPIFNHGKYLEKTINGFLHQKTSFKFEIILHDDCSTDESRSIISRYASKYPDLIVPIFQKENQYSKGKKIIKEFILPVVKGKYIAYCEGDDYWIDDDKLQKQVEYMENNPSCSFCFTNAYIINVKNNKQRSFVPYTKGDRRFVKTNYSVFELDKLSFIPTCSFLYPTNNYYRFPDFFWEPCFGGDRKISLFSTAIGYAHFINEATCVYNYAVPGSALTKRKTKKDIATIQMSYVNLYKKLNTFLSKINEDSRSVTYSHYLKQAYFYDKSILNQEDVEITKKEMVFADHIKCFLIRIMPNFVFNFLRNLKRIFKV